MEEAKPLGAEIISTVSGWVVTFKPIIVTTREQLEQVRLLRFAELIAFDTETSGLKVSLGARAIGYCLAAVTAENEVTGYYIPVRHVNNDDAEQLPIEVVAPVVQEVLAGVSADALVALHHAKFDLAMARADGITIKRRIRDTMILATVANENETGFSLKRLASKYCCEGAETEEKALGAWMKKDARGLKLSYKKRSINKPDEPTYLERFGYSRTPIDMCGFYGAKDVLYTLYLYAVHYRDVEQEYPAVTEREHRVMRVLHEMEWTGLPADREEILRAHTACVEDLKYWIDEALRLANILLDETYPPVEQITEFELSPQFLSDLLYRKFRLDSPKQTKAGADSTDKESRQLLAHRYPEYAPLIKAIDKAARVEKLASTYTDAFLRHYSEETGRIHPSYNQVERRDEGGVPVTGRLSSGDPNIQNCAKKPAHLRDCKCVYCVAELLGKKVSELDDTERLLVGASNTISVRRYFTVPKGFVRLLVDFSQIELRVLAWFSRDARLLECYANDLDVHAITATEVTSGDRDIAKCFHPDTEVLTRSGWKQILSLRKGEEVLQATPTRSGTDLSWAVPMEVFSKQNDSPTLVHLQNAGIDIRVTHDHRMLVVGGTGLPKVVAPKDMAFQRSWLNAGLLRDGAPDEVIAPNEVLLRLAVAVQADGSYQGSTAIRLRFTKQRKIARFLDLLTRANAPNCWTLTASNNFRVKGVLADRIRAFLDADKTLPWAWLLLSEEARGVVLDEAAHWDSCGESQPKWRMYRYSSCLKKNVDVLQALAAITLRKARAVVTVSTTPNWQNSYVLSVKGKACSRGENLSVTAVPYLGTVACLSVPSSFLLVRDRGVTLICGNSVNFGNSYGMTEIGLAKRMAGYYKDPDGTRKRAKQVLSNYFRTYNGIPRFRLEFARDTRANGNMFVNPFGRPRRLPDIGAFEQWRRERAERMMMSSIISGTAADIMKEAMLRCDRVLQEMSPESKIVQSIHDELVFDLRAVPGWANVAVSIVKEMEDWPLFSDRGVPIRVQCKFTTTDWEHLRELKVLPDGRLQLEG